MTGARGQEAQNRAGAPGKWRAANGNGQELLREQARIQALIRFDRNVQPALEPVNGHPVPSREQSTEPFRHLLRVEYGIVRRLCDLTGEQRKKVARAGEAALEEAARQYQETRIKRRGPRGLGQYPFPDCGRIIQTALIGALRDFVSAEAAERYRVETEQRDSFRKQAVVRNMVVELDAELRLSPSQHDRIKDSLLSEWTDLWAERIPTSNVVGSPLIPALLVMPHLSEDQRALWEQSRQEDRGYSFITERPPVQGIEDEDLAEARRAANGETSEHPRKPGGG